MNEYNFNIEEIEGAGAENGNPPSPKKPKKNTALKIAASLMAMTLVSAGSIGVYRHFTEPKADTVVSESSQAAENENIKAENVSMLQISESKDGVLTTEEVVQKVMPSVVGIKSEFETMFIN